MCWGLSLQPETRAAKVGWHQPGDFFMLMVHNHVTLQYYSQLSLLNKITTNVIAKSQKNDLLQVSPKYVDSLLILAPLAPLYMGSGAFH